MSENNYLALNEVEIFASPLLEGCRLGVMEGRRVAVSPALMDLLRTAKDQREVRLLVESLMVLRMDPPKWPVAGLFHLEDFK